MNLRNSICKITHQYSSTQMKENGWMLLISFLKQALNDNNGTAHSILSASKGVHLLC